MASLEIVSALITTSATSTVAKYLWDAILQGLKGKGVQGISQEISTVKNFNEAEAVLSEQDKQIAPDVAHTLTLGALSSAHQAANGLREERMRQAKMTFNAALALAVIGVLIIFTGVGLLLFRNAVTAGGLTACIGAVTEIISALLFRFNHETNNRLDEVGKDLSAIEKARIAMILIYKIEDPRKRDDAIREAAKDLRMRL